MKSCFIFVGLLFRRCNGVVEIPEPPTRTTEDDNVKFLTKLRKHGKLVRQTIRTSEGRSDGRYRGKQKKPAAVDGGSSGEESDSDDDENENTEEHRLGFNWTIYMKHDDSNDGYVDCAKGDSGAVPVSRCLRYLMRNGRSSDHADGEENDRTNAILKSFDDEFDTRNAHGELDGVSWMQTAVRIASFENWILHTFSEGDPGDREADLISFIAGQSNEVGSTSLFFLLTVLI